MSLPRRGRIPVLPVLVASALAAGLFGCDMGSDENEPRPGAGPNKERADRPSPDRRPNVVVVMSDDQDRFSLRVMDKLRRTIADRGVTFPNYFNTFPLCCPSRATSLTGQFAHNHGTLSNQESKGGGFANFDDSRTVPIALKRSGYRTGFVGKYFNGYGSNARTDPKTIPPGWSRWEALVSGRMFNWKLNDNGELRDYEGQDNYQTDVLGELAAKFIDESAVDERGRPFFLTVWPHAVHTEKNSRGEGPNPRPATRHAESYRPSLPQAKSFSERDFSDKPSFVRRRANRLTPEGRRQLGELNGARVSSLHAVDDLVARLVRTLRESGELDNTYFFYTTDNGFQLGAHGLRAKPFPYEENIRFPLFVRGPKVAQGERSSQLVANVDLAPTILDIAGVEPMRRPDGPSLLPALRKPQAGKQRTILLESFTKPFVGVRTQRYVYVEHDLDRDEGPDEFELYDLARDPWQLRNMLETKTGKLRQPSSQAKAKLRALRAELEELRDCAGKSCFKR